MKGMERLEGGYAIQRHDACLLDPSAAQGSPNGADLRPMSSYFVPKARPIDVPAGAEFARVADDPDMTSTGLSLPPRYVYKGHGPNME